MVEIVNPQVTDAVALTNAKVVGESPAMAVGTAAQVMAHGMSLALENAPVRQVGLQDAATATAVVGVTKILAALQSAGGAGGGGGGGGGLI